MDDLKKLACTKLKVPSGLKPYVKKECHTLNRTNQSLYINYLELWHEKLLLRTFAFNKYGEIKEVCRRLEGKNKVLLDGIENTYYAGRQVYYEIIACESNCYWDVEHYKKMDLYVGNKDYWWFWGKDLYDQQEWIDKLDVPFCGWMENKSKMDITFFDYICLYRKEPKIELLVKAGYARYLSSLKYLDVKQKQVDKIFKVDKKWVPYLKTFGTCELLIVRRYKWIENLEDLRKVMCILGEKRIPLIRKYISKKMMEYIEEKISNSYYYRYYEDYLRFAEKTGCDMTSSKVLYPDDLTKAHDEAYKKMEVMKNKMVNDGIKEQADKLKKYSYQKGNLMIRPAESNDELINESRVLCHCVRTYAKQVAEGKTGIMLIRRIDQEENPYVTLELNRRRIVQVRGYRNNINKPLSAEVKSFVKDWKQKFHLKGEIL